jgi:16S rRNA (adenine1518-N6/adenine1519-N6)-dimethyltransferase
MSVKKLLREPALYPKKSLGQNFLVSAGALQRIVAAAELSSADVVLEVGPGLGSLTRLLAAQAGHVVAVELDPQLVEILRRELAGQENVTIIQGDILALAPGELVAPFCQQPARGPCPGVQYKVVANLPYYITSAILRHLLTAEVPPQVVVVTVQHEVARRIVAGPGKMSLLAVSVQFYGQPRIVTRIPAGAFYPVPKVDSAVVRIDRHEHPAVAVADVGRFFALVRAGFGQRRKQLRNALAAGLGRPTAEIEAALRRAGIEPRRRAETLSLAEWGQLYREVEEHLAPVGHHQR